jgi:hypothetical protein
VQNVTGPVLASSIGPVQTVALDQYWTRTAMFAGDPYIPANNNRIGTTLGVNTRNTLVKE